MGSILPKALREHGAARVRGDWSCCYRGIPQSAPKGLFLFDKILLLNPGTPYKERSVLSHSPPLQLEPDCLVRAPHGPTLNSPQPAPTVSVGLPLHPYSPPCDLKQPGLSWCCSSLVWQGRDLSTWLSPRSPAAGPVGAGLGLQLPCSPRWSQGPFCPEASPYHLFSSVLYTFWSIFIHAGVLLAVRFVPQ